MAAAGWIVLVICTASKKSREIYITGRKLPVPSNFPVMPPSSPATVDRILEYTAVAANALHNVATASQIPFLGRVCTITLTIIPMVQVCNSYIFASIPLIGNSEHQVPTGKMPSYCGRDSPLALCTYEPVNSLRQHPGSNDA
jgi:hypothetical protein